MSAEETDDTIENLVSSQFSHEDPFEVLENQRDLKLNGKPTHGEIIKINNEPHLIQSRGTAQGTNIFVYGSITEYRHQKALQQATGIEKELTEKLRLNYDETNIEYAEYDKSLNSVEESLGEVYFKL